MFDPLFDGLAALLNFCYTLVPNYAGAIALLTALVMLVLFPLNAKSQRSTVGMTKLQPELKALQQKYKDDPARQQAETMALFKQHGVNPIGCILPLLVQGPVFFIMYRIIFGLTRRGEDGTFDPQYLDHGSKLWQALHQEREMVSFGIDLAKTASEAAKASFLGALPFFLLIALCVGTGYFQQYQISRRNPQGGAADNPMAKQMQMMTKIFPLMYLIFGFTLPAGMLVYFLVSNTFRIGQQALIYKLDPTLAQNPGGEKIIEAKATPKGKASAKGKGGAADEPSTNGAAKDAKAAKTGGPNPNTSKKKKRR